jgi:ribosomal protein S18 acetylase RimI-like enzyme
VIDRGELAGYVVAAFGFSLEYQGRDAFVDELYVQPAHRGRGLARAALAHLERECAALGIRALHLEVETGNTRAQALYQSRGFQSKGRRMLSKRLEPL